jgi:hypothetical protein
MMVRLYRAWVFLLLSLLLAASMQIACNASAPTEEGTGARPTFGGPTRQVQAGNGPEGEEPAPIAPQPATPVPALLEARRLTLEWPPSIRQGDSDVIRLSLEVDENGSLQTTAEIPGHETSSEIVRIPDLYDTHQVFAEARLEMAGTQVEPNELASQPLLRGQKVTFYWSVFPREVGNYRGVVWFYLRFVPLEGGPETQRPVTVQTIEIQSVNLLGLGGTPARLLGGIGALAGSVLGLDNVIPWVWKRFKKRETG